MQSDTHVNEKLNSG